KHMESSEERVTAEGSIIPCLLSPNVPLCLVRFAAAVAAARNCPTSTFGMGRNLQEKGVSLFWCKFLENLNFEFGSFPWESSSFSPPNSTLKISYIFLLLVTVGGGFFFGVYFWLPLIKRNSLKENI
ncbi:hypothetical protein AABB24_038527, partial [Solanum stoloniferum]